MTNFFAFRGPIFTARVSVFCRRNPVGAVTYPSANTKVKRNSRSDRDAKFHSYSDMNFFHASATISFSPFTRRIVRDQDDNLT
ncbi:MAG: hypothetical protein Q4C96_06030 [Planctomycetia bacterium]|nr:hypothetical protein [Planctomycetia bacterium]